MALSKNLVHVLAITFLFIYFCYGDGPIGDQSVNIKLLELENEILRLKATNCGSERETQDIINLKEMSQQTEATLKELRKELSELSRSSRIPVVSFRSFLSKHIDKIPTGQIIVFDQVDLNIGTAYNQHNGVFTAPYNGTYIFSMALANPKNTVGAIYMVQSDGDKRTVIEYAFAGQTAYWNMGGITTVTYLSSGDSVWVEGEGGISGTTPTDRYHTGFSGLLVNKQ